MEDSSIIAAATKSISYNIALQVLLRLVSFLSNAIIIRFISRDLLGVINVRLMLLYSTTHCLSREAFRRSCLCKLNKNNAQKIVNLLWLPIPICLFTGFLLRLVWLHALEKPDPNQVSSYDSGVNAVLVSVLIEMLAEPLYVIGQSFHFIKLKVVIEGLSVSIRSIFMIILLRKWQGNGIYAFCCSQILSSLFYTCTYYIYFTWYMFRTNKNSKILPIIHISNVFPTFSNIKEFTDWDNLLLTWSFFKQTIFKQLLTEGERYIMTLLNILSFSEQGIYDVISNLGSLAARFIFLPIEESGYLLFSHLLNREKPAHEQTNIKLCVSVLELLLKLMLLLGLTILTFGYSFSQLLLYLYGGTILSTGTGLTLMRWHCFYIVLLAVNGVTECFVFAAMSQREIDRYNKKMVILSVTFLFLSYYLTGFYGSVGFLLANCFNMGFRITHSLYFIQCYFKTTDLWKLQMMFPSPYVLFTYGICYSITSLSEVTFCCLYGYVNGMIHILIGAVCFIVLLVVIYLKEQSVVQFVKKQFIKKEKLQ